VNNLIPQITKLVDIRFRIYFFFVEKIMNASEREIFVVLEIHGIEMIFSLLYNYIMHQSMRLFIIIMFN
jgi:hypothetical protein